MKIRRVEAEFFHPVGRTDKRTDMKLMITFAVSRTRLNVIKQLTQIKIYTSNFPSEGLLVASIPALLHRKFLKNSPYILQENDSLGV